MMAFMLVIKCMSPEVSLVAKPQSSWSECMEQSKLVETFQYPGTKCEAKCVGKKVFYELWHERETEVFGR